MKDVVRLVAVILVCQLPPVPKTAPARDFGRKHQRINDDDDDDVEDDDHHYHHQHHHHHDHDRSQESPVHILQRINCASKNILT